MTETTTEPATDVAVVGGGLVGLAAAWRLLDRGLAVTVVDPRPLSGASGAAAGMLAPVSEVTYGEQRLLQLSLESLRRYPDFVAELEAATGSDVGFRRDGTLLVATDSGDREQLVELHDFQRSLGLPATMLTSRELRALEPMISPAARCGLHVPADYSVDNRRLGRALLAAVTAAGGRLVPAAVRRIEVGGEAGHGLVTSAGDRIPARHVVLAAGCWVGSIEGLPDEIRPPVRPVKGQILRLRAAAGMPLPDRTLRAIVGGDEVYLVPRRDGELVVGATVEDRGFDTTVTAGAVHDLLRTARSVLPLVDELELVETVAGLRPGSPDNAPLVGRTSVDGLVLAAGHHRNGVLLTPLTADLVADAVTGAAEGAWQQLASPDRFRAVAPA